MSERSHNLSKYCIEFINHYMDVHDPESHFITSVCVVSTSNDQVSSALLSSIASLRSSYLDAGSLPSGDAGHAEIGNLVEMLSLLGFYKDFSSRYFASLDHFYRAYSYSSLLHSSLAAYVRHLQHVLRTVSLASPSHPGILPRRAFPPQSRRPPAAQPFAPQLPPALRHRTADETPTACRGKRLVGARAALRLVLRH